MGVEPARVAAAVATARQAVEAVQTSVASALQLEASQQRPKAFAM